VGAPRAKIRAMGALAATDAPDLSVIIPCFNEAGRLPASLAKAVDYLEGCGRTWELLVVDDGSADATARLAEEAGGGDPRIQVLRYEENRGKGFAVAYGARRTRGRCVLFSDADLSTPLAEMERMLPLLEQGYDVVIASRALRESRLEVRQPWWRERAGRLMNRLSRLLSGSQFADTQCGFKLFSQRAARDIFPNLTVRGWMFDVEVLVLARKLGYAAVDVPVTWINSGESRVKISHLPNILRELLHIRLHWLRRVPERTRDEGEAVAQPSR
jgi:dolichyl-phosphate beta-glucosyltransferase